MERKISETPNKWVILGLPDNHYKVYGTWAGGYLDGDRWKLNSGIKEVEQDDDFYYFIGYSGSCYKCDKKGYGVMTSFGHDVLDKMIGLAKGQVEVLDDVDDWAEHIKE